MVKGDDVRIAGVKVGNVKSVEIVNRTQALVELRRSTTDSTLTESTHATIRYRNLVGQRYIALTQGAGRRRAAAGGRHHPGGPHPARRST